MYSTLKTAIISYLSQSSKIAVAAIYDYEPTLPTGFPAISVTATTLPSEFADTQRNRREYTFRVRCYMNRQTMGADANLAQQNEAERILTNLMDSLISIFDNDSRTASNNGAYNLGGVANLVFVEPVTIQWGYAQAPTVDMRVADLELRAVVVA